MREFYNVNYRILKNVILQPARRGAFNNFQGQYQMHFLKNESEFEH